MTEMNDITDLCRNLSEDEDKEVRESIEKALKEQEAKRAALDKMSAQELFDLVFAPDTDNSSRLDAIHHPNLGLELGAMACERIAKDKDAHCILRHNALLSQNLPDDERIRLTSEIVLDPTDTYQMRDILLFCNNHEGRPALPPDARKAVAQKIADNENDSPKMRGKVRKWILGE